MLAIWSLVPLPFLKPGWTLGSSRFMFCWSLAWRILSISLLACEMSTIVQLYEHSLALASFGTGMKTDLFLSCGQCWVFQIPWHTECSTFTALSFWIYFNLFFYFLTLQYCICFAIYQHESVTGIHVFLSPPPSSLHPPCPIPLGRLSAPAPSIQYHASNLDCTFNNFSSLWGLAKYSDVQQNTGTLINTLKIKNWLMINRERF